MVDTSAKNNASLSGSQDESDADPSVPLPPIKNEPSHKKQNSLKGVPKKPLAVKDVPVLKNEGSQQSLGIKAPPPKRRVNEEAKVERLKNPKKGFIETLRLGKKKK